MERYLVYEQSWYFDLIIFYCSTDIYTKLTSVVINAKGHMGWATIYYNIGYDPVQPWWGAAAVLIPVSNSAWTHGTLRLY